MRESELFQPVKTWLESFGYAVMAEIPKVFADPGMIDVVGWRPGRYPVIVEMKIGFTRKLATQARAGQTCTPFVYAAAPTNPQRQFMLWASKYGFGVLKVTNTVEVLQKPRLHDFNRMGEYHYHKKFRQRCTKYIASGVHLDNTVGGCPTLAGVGPAQEVSRRVAAYRNAHPQATWREIFANVANHYNDHNSMRCALRSRGLA